MAALKQKCVKRSKDSGEKIRKEFEPKGIKVYPISAISGEGVRTLLYDVNNTVRSLK